MARIRRPANPAVPTECWYAVARAGEVGRDLLAIRVAATSLVLFRTTDGSTAALEDCCAHRPYPLSAGRLDGDVLRCGLCGFCYDATGACVRVPTQIAIPVGAAVRAYPVREEHGLIWVWLGKAGRAGRHRIPSLPWLTAPDWTEVAGARTVAANYLRLHESFADVTKIPVLTPDVAPAVLSSAPPPLDVVVTETTVSSSREFPPEHLPVWQSRALGADPDAKYEHHQEGHFLSPAVWVDHWDVTDGAGEFARIRFVHLVTPIDETTTSLRWIVSRDFAGTNAGLTAELEAMFVGYYERTAVALETTQAIVDRDGPRREVNVSADVAALKVREIVSAMLTEEGTRRR
jgi:vanillate O-demethylase monooxygenase subunit